MELYDGPLNVESIFCDWNKRFSDKNYGVLLTFVGIVREENNISALSFDVYEPILQNWLDSWHKKASKDNAIILFAHSKGNVPIHTSSFMAGILTRERRLGLTLINDFVEDFKASAPIWKYDIIDNKRIFAKERSNKIEGFGLLS